MNLTQSYILLSCYHAKCRSFYGIYNSLSCALTLLFLERKSLYLPRMPDDIFLVNVIQMSTPASEMTSTKHIVDWLKNGKPSCAKPSNSTEKASDASSDMELVRKETSIWVVGCNKSLSLSPREKATYQRGAQADDLLHQECQETVKRLCSIRSAEMELGRWLLCWTPQIRRHLASWCWPKPGLCFIPHPPAFPPKTHMKL